LPAGLATLVAALCLAGGIPELWHDWRIPPQPGAASSLVASLFEPWLPGGIGAAQPYPTFYLVGFLLWPMRFVGAFGIVGIIVFATVALAARAAAQLVRGLGGDEWTSAAAAIFAALNPWVYSKYVAGHVLMVFAYAILLALLAEIARARPRRWAVIVLTVLTITQIEFFVIVVVPLAAWLAAKRAYRALFALGVAAAPIAYGIAATYSQIRGTPFNLSWQDTQSLDPGQALLLNGYVFDYAHAFSSVWLGTLVFAVVAAMGIVPVLRARRFAIVLGIAASAYVLTTGTKGPIAPLYRYAVLRFPEIGLFRELYDLIALVAIAYVVCIACGAGRRRVAGVVLSVAALSYLIPWLKVPPASFFVGAPLLPQAPVPRRPSERIAFLPAFQPMTFGGRGSGVDPDAYVRDGFASPLNEFFPTYPVDAALGFAAFRNDDRYLAALGVTSLVVRPYLQSNLEALKYQWVETSGVRSGRRRPHALAGLPLLSAGGVPGTATIGNRPDESAIFFGDLEPARVRTFEPSRASNDAGADWVDARLSIPLHPDWGTAFGGVTTQSLRPLALPLPSVGTSLLAHVDGTLGDESGRTVVPAKAGLHWWPLPAGVRSVRCRGTCIVILQALVPTGVPEHRPLLPSKALDVRFVAPWLARAEVPPHFHGTLRLNVRYDGAWAAFIRNRPLPHVRLDTAVNGWNVTTSGAATVSFVQRTAAVQFALELAAAAVIATLLALELLAYSRSRRRDANGGAAASFADTRGVRAPGHAMPSSSSFHRIAASRDGS